MRRTHVDKTARRVRQALAGVMWVGDIVVPPYMNCLYNVHMPIIDPTSCEQLYICAGF